MKNWYRRLKRKWDRDVRPVFEPVLRALVLRSADKELQRWKNKGNK